MMGLPLSNLKETEATGEEPSTVEAWMFILPLTVEPFTGVVIFTVGGWVCEAKINDIGEPVAVDNTLDEEFCRSMP